MMTIQQAFVLGLQHHQAGRLAEAEGIYQQILAVQPNHAETLHCLGVALYQTGQLPRAAECVERSLALEPRNVMALANLGEIERLLGRLPEAVASLRQAIALDPADAPAHYNLANALRDLGRSEEAITEFRYALQLHPGYAEAYNNLATLLREKGQVEEAVAAYRQALAEKPDFAEAWSNLGTALRMQRRFEGAIEAFRDALALRPDYAEAYNNLGITYVTLGMLDAAVVAYQRALTIQPDLVAAHNNLGNVLKDLGDLRGAVKAYREAMRLDPDNSALHSNLIYTMHFDEGQTAGAIAGEQAAWGRRFAVPLRSSIRPPARSREPGRRLRVGYVSPDFRAHVVGRLIMPLLQHTDRRQYEIFCYSDVRRPDEVTQEIQRQTDGWRHAAGVSDETLCEWIREDGIDILVDLTQHMADNRLLVFARRPAPVQVSFAGYPAGTGLETIEHRISDRYLEVGSEKSVHCIDSFLCYAAHASDVTAARPPAEENGWVTFGTLNNFCKVNEGTLRCWAEMLQRVPHSRLLLLGAPGSHRERTGARLEAEGVAASRVEFVEPCARQEYFKLYHRIDIALDPFPYGGHTTSADAIWMGVPIVSLAGETALSRLGLSILSNLGLPQLVAFSKEDYVKLAVQLAGDLPQLSEWRTTLRSRMQSSPLMDAAGFARQIEAAYRAMWREWCEKEPAE